MNGKINGADVSKMLDWLVKLMVLVLVPMLMWMSGTLIGIDKRVTAIEANRFTAADGSRLWEEMYKRPTFDDVPPPWFLDEVNEIKVRLDRLEERTR